MLPGSGVITPNLHSGQSLSQELPVEILKIHALAVQQGREAYVDPFTGHYVFTALRLIAQGACCGRGCRHCPWPPEEQARAGRPGS